MRAEATQGAGAVVAAVVAAACCAARRSIVVVGSESSSRAFVFEDELIDEWGSAEVGNGCFRFSRSHLTSFTSRHAVSDTQENTEGAMEEEE